MVDVTEKTTTSRIANRWYWLGTAGIALAIAVWCGYDMWQLLQEDRLWGYRPLTLLFWSYAFLSVSLAGLRGMDRDKTQLYILGSCTAVLMALSFPPVPLLILAVPAWALLIHLTDRVGVKSVGYQFRYFFHIFILWNIITTYWISNTAFAAGIVAISTNALLMTIPVLLYNFLKKNISSKFHWVVFAACWMSFEYFHFRWEAHWPWLALGHYFMETPWLIQWYEFIGIQGGTLWLLVLAFLLSRRMTDIKSVTNRKFLLPFLSVLLLPISISLLTGLRSIAPIGTSTVAIVQPNYEPHYEKGKIPVQQEVQHFLNLATEIVDDSTDYLIFPETSFSINLNNWQQHRTVRSLRQFLDRHQHLTLISGLETNKILQPGEPHDQYTRTYIRNNDTIYWENHNTAVRMSSTQPMEIYYKSKLVPGAEFFPFKKALFFLKPLMDKLGGSGSGLRKQDEREAFQGLDGYKIAPVICYESVYGEYVSEYFDAGAQCIAVMTNDGWWDNTAGHKQHLGLSVLRAIEQRKYVARSANTGISCIIDTKGTIHQPTKYGVATAIKGPVDMNNYRTLYSRIGDILGRLACLFLVGLLLGRVRKWIK